MKGYIEINYLQCGNSYYNSAECCGSNKNFKLLKRKNIKSWNSQENYYKCIKCGQIIMIQNQEFQCSHKKKERKDLSCTVYIKKKMTQKR